MAAKNDQGQQVNPSERIDQLVVETADWRGRTLAKVRQAILQADPEVAEDWKYMGSPVWSCSGSIAVGNAHKDKVKLTFAHGASLSDPHKLFNNGFGGKVWRAIDLHEGDEVDGPALTELVRAAIEYNRAKAKTKKPASRARATAAPQSGSSNSP